MELTWGTIALLLIAIGVGWFWQDSLRAREAANVAAMEACLRMQLQFLDGTVAFSHLRWVRDRGRLTLRRTYVFDYTATSMERLQGFVVLLGSYVETVGFARTLQPARTVNSDTVVETPPPDDARPTAAPGKVLSLEEWRKSRRND